MEPESGEAAGGELAYTDIDTDLQEVKKECLEYSERIDLTGGKKKSPVMLVNKFSNNHDFTFFN